jgi:predicted dehydrogenase
MSSSDNIITANEATPSGAGRRRFLQTLGLGAASVGLTRTARAADQKAIIQGFEEEKDAGAYKGWQPVSDRKIRVGLVGYGYCTFAGAFGFQNHPNVEVVAVSDLFPDRCAALAKRAGCNVTYPSLEEMVKDKRIEAIFIATDAPSHVRHCELALAHGKHVAVAVPAVYGSLEDADRLLNVVKRSGLKYMMFETSCFHQSLYAMREIHRAGGFGKVLYTEGAYIHHMDKPLPSYKEWRVGSIPMWYCTHATAYHIGVTGGHFTEVSCLGTRSDKHDLQPTGNKYQNPFGTQVALFRTNEDGSARMVCSKEIFGSGAESGYIRGTRGSYQKSEYSGREKNLPPTKRPPLPPGVPLGAHGGSHGYLTNEFVLSILENRKPWIDIATALNMTVPGIIAHQSALKGGELLKVPHFTL